MNNREIENNIRNAYLKIQPNQLESILSDCEQKERRYVLVEENRNENRKQAPEWRRIPEPVQFFFSYFFSYSASTLQRMIRSLPLGSAGISSTHSKW